MLEAASVCAAGSVAPLAGAATAHDRARMQTASTVARKLPITARLPQGRPFHAAKGHRFTAARQPLHGGRPASVRGRRPGSLFGTMPGAAERTGVRLRQAVLAAG